ncbi:hypothetical protein O1611_g6217 [Lasiodiplodia mahajangana]|uniref:Uncharacterized protein n=1 Tax=Lasiodiplodia mahajangana TaxID=1108764 RepID=A0ACC2JJ88_9PEZI|nr:hypothetical protein O1611_g6217 [Lasiodiplodia mahajangana]
MYANAATWDVVLHQGIYLARKAAEYLRKCGLVYAVPGHALPDPCDVLAGFGSFVGLARLGFCVETLFFDESVCACEGAHRGAPGDR